MSWLKSFLSGLAYYLTVGRKLNLFNKLYVYWGLKGSAAGVIELYFILEDKDLDEPKLDLDDLFFLSFIRLFI